MSGIGVYGFDERYGYPESATMRDVQFNSWGADANTFRLKEASGEHVGISVPGVVNPIYGPMLAQLGFVQANTLSIFPQTPFRLGQRVEWEPAGMGKSASVVRGGQLPLPVRGQYATIETPHKVCTASHVMELGLVQIGNNNTEDIAVWEKQIMNNGRSFLRRMNEMLLRKVEDAPVLGEGTIPGQPGGDTQRTELESLERIFSSAEEAQYVPDTYAVPWYNDEANRISGGNSMMEKFRSQDSLNTMDFTDDLMDSMGANVIHSYKETTTTGEADDYRVVSQNTLSEIYNKCAPWWDNNATAGKAFVTGYDTLQKLQSQSENQQRFLNTEYATVGVNGINSLEGRDIGFQVASYASIPIVPERLIGRGDATNPNKGVGRLYLMDLDHTSRATLIDMNIMVTDNRLIAGSFNRVANFMFMGEMVATKFRGSGKAIHLA